MQNGLTKPVDSSVAGGINVAADVHGIRTLIANLYFIGTPGDSKEWILVDAGMGDCADKIQAYANSLFGENAAPKAIILTHGHFDHVGALNELAVRWNVPVYTHSLELPFLTGLSSYPPGDPGVGGGAMAWLSFLYPRAPANLGNRVQALPNDGTIGFLPDWKIIHTPGHTPGHISLYRESDGVLIAGDAVVTTKQESALSAMSQKPQVVRRPPAYFTIDWEAAALSVRRLADLRPEIIATGHGLPMRGAEMQRELDALARDFEQIAVPTGGRYAKQPARSNELGITEIPPPTAQGQIPKIAAAAVVAGAVFGLWTLLRPRAK